MVLPPSAVRHNGSCSCPPPQSPKYLCGFHKLGCGSCFHARHIFIQWHFAVKFGLSLSSRSSPKMLALTLTQHYSCKKHCRNISQALCIIMCSFVFVIVFIMFWSGVSFHVCLCCCFRDVSGLDIVCDGFEVYVLRQGNVMHLLKLQSHNKVRKSAKATTMQSQVTASHTSRHCYASRWIHDYVFYVFVL